MNGRTTPPSLIENGTALAAATMVPLWLFIAHFDHGADAGHGTAAYSLGLLICFSVLLIVSRFAMVSTGMVIIVGLFWGWASFGLFGNCVIARHDIQVLGAAGAIAGIGYVIGSRSRWLNYAWTALCWSLLLFSGLALFLFQSASGSTAFLEQGQFDGRLAATFGSPNTAATLFGLAMLVALSHIMQRLSDARLQQVNRRDRIYRFTQSEAAQFGLLFLAGFSLVLTQSRAGIFFSLLAASLLIVIELSRASRFNRFRFLRGRPFQISMGSIVAIVLVLALTGEINPNNSEALLQNGQSRLATYEIYISIWLERPIFGHGLGTFNALNDSHTTLENAANLIPNGAAHNVLLQWLIEQGIAGVLLMLVVLSMIFVPIVRALGQDSDRPRHFLRLSIAASLLIFAHGMVDFALEIPSVMWTYTYLLGLAAGFSGAIGKTVRKADE